ncbi:cysteine hydrolase [Epibacterium ulvae]|uniref:cysteine hydrolase family protein n=1 Tax=Epibacterium ulvae TaxID=1156985 RepID=UPI001BFC8521|nr:cysteine hydrolase [Epibacterium ulvae]MBT8152678.1 cysteine hydrolase [Epibacterium ulvae]
MNSWLMVIDMQPGFADPASPWATPGVDSCQRNIRALLPQFENRVLFTRFVPPAAPRGAWVPYYDQWSFARDAQNAWMWELVPEWQGQPAVTGHRFAKWQEARAHIPQDATVVMCGVATDCCVLGTAIEAADEGRFIRLVTDACAAGTEALHGAALDVMRDRAPMIALTDTATEFTRHTV